MMELNKIFQELSFKTREFPNKEKLDFLFLWVTKGTFEITFSIHLKLYMDDDFWKKNREQLKTLFKNNIFFSTQIDIKKDDIIKFIESNYPYLSPGDKAIKLLEYINTMTSYDGEKIDIDLKEINENEEWRLTYHKNIDEFEYYIEVLKQMGYIDWSNEIHSGYLGLNLTLKGLEKIVINQQNKYSNYCFIGMSFDSDLENLFNEAIKPALLATGFEPLIVNQVHIDSDVTINDAILASIKKARFTIADFTRHKHGVYFEAGYALGRGQKVIYTCHQDDIAKAHFDTRNYQHIIWNDYNDLKNQLISKIEAFIKD